MLAFLSSFSKFIDLYKLSNDMLTIVNRVRWHPNGELLATASSDQSVKILDCKTEKTLYTTYTLDGSNALSFFIPLKFFYLNFGAAMAVCFL